MRPSFFIALLFFSTVAFSQYKIELGMGYGTYAMKDLKLFQKELLPSFPSGAKITEAFPGYVYYDGAITKLIGDRYTVGAYGAYGSTGGRISYQDYSGEVSSNQLVKYLAFGVPLGLKLDTHNSGINVELKLKTYLSFNFFDLQFYSRLGNQTDEESYKFRSINFGFEPGITFEKHFQNFGVGFFASYNLNVVKGNLYFEEEEDAYLQNESGDPIRTEFSGARIGIYVMYEFQ